MRQIDLMTPQEIDVLKIKGMLPDSHTPAQSQHSPLPWTVSQASEGTLDINYSDGEIHSRIARLHIECLADEHNYGGIVANASFIVHACNNAQRLADALSSVCANSYRNTKKTTSVRNDSMTEARQVLAQWKQSQ